MKKIMMNIVEDGMAWASAIILVILFVAIMFVFVELRSEKVNVQPVDTLAQQIPITTELAMSMTKTDNSRVILIVEKVQDLPDVGLYRVLARRRSDNVMFSAISAKQFGVGDKVVFFFVYNQPHATSAQKQSIFVAVKVEVER